MFLYHFNQSSHNLLIQRVVAGILSTQIAGGAVAITTSNNASQTHLALRKPTGPSAHANSWCSYEHLGVLDHSIAAFSN